jgi:hypothetical protein
VVALLQQPIFPISTGSESLDELMSNVVQKLGIGDERGKTQLLVSLTNLTCV